MYDARQIVYRIKLQAKIKHISIVKMLKDLGLNNGYLSDSIQNKSGMAIANFYAIAAYLNVSCDYLLGLSDNPEVLK